MRLAATLFLIKYTALPEKCSWPTCIKEFERCKRGNDNKSTHNLVLNSATLLRLAWANVAMPAARAAEFMANCGRAILWYWPQDSPVTLIDCQSVQKSEGACVLDPSLRYQRKMMKTLSVIMSVFFCSGWVVLIVQLDLFPFVLTLSHAIFRLQIC